MTKSEGLSDYNVHTGQEVRKLLVTVDLYIDVFFVINMILDYLVLSITGKVMRYRAGRYRIVLGAALGAAWAVLCAAFPSIPPAVSFFMTYAVVSCLMVVTAFGVRKKREIGKAVACLYLVTVMMAGAMQALYQHTMAGYYIEQILRGNNRAAMPFYRLLLLAAGAYFGVRCILGFVLEARKSRNHFYEVTMHYRGRKKTVTALLDTGNRLYEPVTHRPVHVVTYEALKELCESVSSVICIPFGSVGKKEGVMPGIFLDEMEIRQGSDVKIIEKPLVAVCRRPLSVDGEYQMLLHED